MSPLFRRSAEQSAVLPPQRIETEALGTPLSPFEFVDKYQEALLGSSRQWADIASDLTELSSPELQAQLRGNLEYIYSLSNIAAADESLDSEAARLTKQMGTFQLLVARHKSGGEELTEILHRGLDRSIYEFTDTNLAHLLRHDRPAAKAMIQRVNKISIKMRSADYAAHGVLANFAHEYTEAPESLMEFTELYQDGVADIDVRFRELKEIITADWLHVDPTRSILRSYCDRLRANPDIFVNTFISEALQSDERQWQGVQSMARFAIAATSRNGMPLSMREILLSTYPDWVDFPEVDSVFRTFVENKASALEQALNQLAGVGARKSIRLHRSREEVDNFKSSLYIHYSGSRQSRRKETKVRNLQKEPLQGLPSTAEVRDQIAIAETIGLSKQLALLRNSPEGPVLQTASMDELLKEFSIKTGNGLEADVRKMLTRLQQEPLSAATVRVRNHKGKLNYAGGKLTLWRFAPEDSPNLGVHPQNRYHRVVYAVSSENLVVVDIMDHDSFDKKY